MPLLNRTLPSELKNTIAARRMYVFFFMRRSFQPAAHISSARHGGAGNPRLPYTDAGVHEHPTELREQCARPLAAGSNKNHRTGSPRPSSLRGVTQDTRYAGVGVRRHPPLLRLP